MQVFDIGQNLAGVAELKVSGPAGTTITMKYGERLTTEGLVDQAIIATHIWRMGRDQQFQTDTYTLKGEGEERWRARFVYHGFQYVQVEGAPEPLTADNLRAIFAHTAVKPAGKFESSNPLLNRIWENARWSYLSNLHGIPTDCPHREKNGWTGDAHLAVEFGLLNFDTLPLYEKWINDLGDEQRATGQLPGIVPTSGWGYAWGNGPAWDSAFLIIPETLRIFTGDTRSLDRHHAGHMRYVDYLTSQSKEGGIVDIGLGDYVPWKTETPEGVTSTGYYYQDLKIVAATARRLGREDDARLYEARAEAVREAFNAKYFDAASGLYAGGTQTALSGALHHGLVPAAEKERVAQRLAEAVLATDGHIDTGILGARYILEALTATGRADLAYAMAAKETQPGWGWWIGQGATTLWEIWNGGGSRNHIMLGDVAAWFVRSLAGIRPDPEAPGFRRVLIEPHPVEGLEWAKAEYDSVRGTIASGWRRENGRITLDVTIPANVTAEIRLPAVADVRESGRPLADADIWSINVYEGSTVIETGAGKYRFDWKE